MKTIVCLVSRQVMANLIPIFTHKVQKVELLYTKEEERAHINLKRVLNATKRKFKINEHLIDAYDFEGIRDVCSKIISQNKDIVLNATGGTKVMALAAYSVFNSANKPILYLDSQNNRTINFNPYSISDHNIKIPIDTILDAHGYGISSTISKDDLIDRKPLIKFMHKNFKSIESCLIQYRRFMNDGVYMFSPIICRNPKFEITHHRIKGVNVSFEGAEMHLEDVYYLDGHWLEEYVYWSIKTKKWDDLLVGVTLTYHGQENTNNVLNEVDVMGNKNGKLYLFSCKSGITKDKKDLFELEALRSLAGGTFGKAYFVTSAPISKDKHLYERCQELKIKIFDKDSFRTLLRKKF